MYVKSIQSGRNGLLVKMLEKAERVNGKWIRELRKETVEAGMSYEGAKKMKQEEIRRELKGWDDRRWKEEMAEKSTLQIYREYKGEIKETMYMNSEQSRIKFQLRTNTLKLNEFRRHTGGIMKCDLCGWDREDLEHFIIDCPELEVERTKIKKLQRPLEEDRRRIIGELLFGETEEWEGLYRMCRHVPKVVALEEGKLFFTD